ncbi:polysaccharide deacetylase family protein [Bacillus massiliglaciei]|uniref:polysaccharide deacetylase family protein n=1 Tax=Bacillus massiliglaciei TaxID=1816693 RepID=UPI000A5EE383|nr:polysaccharide deacetylase family protein [Bacillus massiliglaciei]
MKYIYFLLICIGLLLAGCAAEKTSTEHEKAVKEESHTEKDKTAEKQLEEEPKYRINENNWSVEPIADANPKVILLTFDDAPDKYAVQIAKTLKELHVKAIFFVNGHFLETKKNQEMLKEIHQLGFPIGNHTYNHVNLKELSEEEQKKEIVQLNDQVEELIGERPKFFRAPFGGNTDFSKKTAKDEKMLIMNWTYGYDWEKQYQNKEALTKIMTDNPYLTNGANLLMHDRKWTSEAIADIVKQLQKKGYTIVDPSLIKTP